MVWMGAGLMNATHSYPARLRRTTCAASALSPALRRLACRRAEAPGVQARSRPAAATRRRPGRKRAGAAHVVQLSLGQRPRAPHVVVLHVRVQVVREVLPPCRAGRVRQMRRGHVRVFQSCHLPCRTTTRVHARRRGLQGRQREHGRPHVSGWVDRAGVRARHADSHGQAGLHAWGRTLGRHTTTASRVSRSAGTTTRLRPSAPSTQHGLSRAPARPPGRAPAEAPGLAPRTRPPRAARAETHRERARWRGQRP